MRRIKRGPRDACTRLGVAPGSELRYIERIGYVDETPVLVEKSGWFWVRFWTAWHTTAGTQEVRVQG